MALCGECGNSTFEDFEHCYELNANNHLTENMMCKKCYSPTNLENFFSNLSLNTESDEAVLCEDPPKCGSIENTTDVFGGMEYEKITADSFEKLKMILYSWPCFKCGNDKQADFSFVCDDDNTILSRSCDKCDQPMGLDEGMTPEQVQQLVTNGRMRVRSCECGNDDSYKVTIEEREHQVVLVCNECDAIMENLGHINNSEIADLELVCECGNKQQDLFAVTTYARTDEVIHVTCLACSEQTVCENTPNGVECSCGNTSLDLFNVTYDEWGYIDNVKCVICDNELKQGKAKDQEPSRASGRTRITQSQRLRPGDHVAWNRTLGYWHHAIVTEVGTEDNFIKVIEYKGEIIAAAGTIEEDWMYTDCKNERFFRIDYRGDVNPPDKVIDLARSRLEESCYNVFTNNCEHFASWAKSCCKRSIQVENVCEFLKRVGGKAIGTATRAIYKVVKSIKNMSIRVQGPWTEFAKLGMGEIAATTAFLALFEVGFCSWDIWDYHKQRLAGDIDRTEFINATFERSARAVGGIGGAAVGAYGGAALGAAVGAFGGPAGAAAGSYIGLLLGQTVGFLLGSFLGKLAAGCFLR